MKGATVDWTRGEDEGHEKCLQNFDGEISLEIMWYLRDREGNGRVTLRWILGKHQ
jgi:hypothetical protein